MQEQISVMVACKPMSQYMRAYQRITTNPCPRISAENQLVSRMVYTMRIFFCLLVLVVSIDDPSSTETCLICEEH
jgi:hypothetical protein